MNKIEYINPSTLEEAESYLKNRKLKNSYCLSGGTDLLGLMKDSVVKVENIVNLKKIKGLSEIKYEKGVGIKIGSLVKVQEIFESNLIKEKVKLLSDTAREIASPQLRNVGTVGGNLCQRPRCWYFRGDFDCYRKGGGECFAETGENKFHAVIGGSSCFIVHPSDLATSLMALNGKFGIFSNGKIKYVEAEDFFILPDDDIEKENILEKGEILAEIVIPEKSLNKKGIFIKTREREVFDFATVSVAINVEINGKKIKEGKIVFGGVAPAPWFEKKCSKMLSGLILNEENIEKVAENALKNAKPLSGNKYKLILAKNLIKKGLREFL